MPKTERELMHAIARCRRLANTFRSQYLKHDQSACLLEAERHVYGELAQMHQSHATYLGHLSVEAEKTAAKWAEVEKDHAPIEGGVTS